MTSRERLVAAARGGEVDEQPTIRWPSGSGLTGDALVVAPWLSMIRDAVAQQERAVLAEVANPFGYGRQRGQDLVSLMESDPSQGDAALRQTVDAVRAQIADSLAAGADGVLYCLYGAHPIHTSPMQYGGFFLDRDRELLEEIRDARLNAVFVVGGEGTYLDFVSDLPAQLFGWDARESGVLVESMRSMRSGALMSEDPESDVLLQSDVAAITSYLEERTLARL